MSQAVASAVRMTDLPAGTRRGTTGMILTVITEALLFSVLFFAYFYIGQRTRPWPPDPPEVGTALVLLAVLLTSSWTLLIGERALRRGQSTSARKMLFATIVLGIGFLVLQFFEYRDHLKELKPSTNAYGSIFYIITSFHALHVVVGLLMLIFVAALPMLGPQQSPHLPLHNAGLYWHFVDVVWVFVVAFLYLLPQWSR